MNVTGASPARVDRSVIEAPREPSIRDRAVAAAQAVFTAAVETPGSVAIVQGATATGIVIGHAALGVGLSPLEAVAASIVFTKNLAKQALAARLEAAMPAAKAAFMDVVNRAAHDAAETVMARVLASPELIAASLAAQPAAEAASLAVIESGLALGRPLEELTDEAAIAAKEVVKAAIAPIFSAAQAEAEEASRQVFSQF